VLVHVIYVSVSMCECTLLCCMYKQHRWYVGVYPCEGVAVCALSLPVPAWTDVCHSARAWSCHLVCLEMHTYVIIVSRLRFCDS
jgi:hypothetical protein